MGIGGPWDLWGTVGLVMEDAVSSDRGPGRMGTGLRPRRRLTTAPALLRPFLPALPVFPARLAGEGAPPP